MIALELFRSELARHGLRYGGPLYADGRLYRFMCEGDHDRNSWYVLFAGPPMMASGFGCWKRGIKETWAERSPKSMTDAEWDDVRRRWREADAERHRVEVGRQARAQKLAQWLLSRAKPASDHPYLRMKGVSFHEGLFTRGEVLLVPLLDCEGEVQTLQFISADGKKRFLKGGKVAGSMALIIGPADHPVVLCEGWGTGASIHEATGHPVACAMNAGNLPAVATALRKKFPDRAIVVAADNDALTAGNPGLSKARDAALVVGARLAIPAFKDTSTKPSDFNDLAQLEGLRAVKEQINNTQAPNETDDDAFTRLAQLPLADYDRVRESEAQRLSIRVGTLDREVGARRPKPDTVTGSAVLFPEIPEWPEMVDGAELLDEIHALIRRYIVASDDVIVACALFVLHSYAFDLGDISPLLFITAPTKRCGKTKLLGLLAKLVHRPLSASSASPAGIYRTIEMHRPTILIDEIDTFLKGDEQLRGLINSGHTRDAAFHLGCVQRGDDFVPRRWSTWTPKILAGIGRLAPTLEDRAIVLQLRRRLNNEPVERLRHSVRFEDIRGKCAKFVSDHAEQIRDANPDVPDALNDRAADNWATLLVLADLAGEAWSSRARTAALELSGAADIEPSDLKEQLLADIQATFAEAQVDRLASKDLADRLAKLEARPWAEFGKGQKPISSNQLAYQLRHLGITSRTVRIGDATAKGYCLDDFSDAFNRYLAGNPISKGNKVTSPVNKGESPVFGNVTSEPCDVSENTVSANAGAGCDDVTFREQEKGGNDTNDTKKQASHDAGPKPVETL